MKFHALREKLSDHFKQLNPLFKTENWHRSHYMLMQNTINDGLRTSPYMNEEMRFSHGSTISHMTLKRFFDQAYNEHSVEDLRFIKTVDKLCIYLGYRDYLQFVSSFDPIENSVDLLEYFKEYIKGYFKARIDFLKEIPEYAEKVLGTYICQNGPYFARLKEFKTAMFVRNVELQRNSNQISMDLIDLRIVSTSDNELVLETQEFWFLQFYAKDGKEGIYNNTNKYLYFLKKEGCSWKIWNNYNPDFTLCLKKMKDNTIVVK